MTVVQVSVSKVFKQPLAVAIVCFKGEQRFIAAWLADHDAWPASLGTRLLVAPSGGASFIMKPTKKLWGLAREGSGGLGRDGARSRRDELHPDGAAATPEGPDPAVAGARPKGGQGEKGKRDEEDAQS